MDINELKKLGAKSLDISIELCQKSLEKGIDYFEKLDFHSAIREFTAVIDILPELVKLTKNLNLPPKIEQQGTITLAKIAHSAYLGRFEAYTQIGEKEKANDDKIMAEKLKNSLPSTLQKPLAENKEMLFETINSKKAQSTNSSNDIELKDFKYSRIGSSEIKIEKYIGSATYVDIPSQIDDLPVTTIGSGAFINCKSLKSVQIPNSVIYIDVEAFRGCKSLTSVQIPNSVTTIGAGAFNECNSLTSIQIQNSVTSIGEYAFRNCFSLTSIQIPNSVTSIGAGAFIMCKSLKSVKLPNSITMIGGGTFIGCESLTSIQIPNSVTMIDGATFSQCSSLTSVQIPNSVTSIGQEAFQNCESLTLIQIPNSVTFIGEYAFNCCKSLKSIQIPNSVTSIGQIAFSECESLISIQIPDSVTSIGEMAFCGCSSLTSIQIPESTILGEEVFKDCNASLKILRTPNTKKASEVKTSVASTGCIVPSVIFVYGMYWITKSIGNFLFG